MSALNAAWLAGTFGPQATILNWSTSGAKTGLLSGVAANAPLFAFRNSGSNVAWIIRVSVAFNVTTAFTTAQSVDLGLFACRLFTASDSGGVQIVLSGDNGIRRSQQMSFSSCDMRIAVSAALTAGNRVPDATAVGIAEGWAGVAVGAAIPLTDLFAYSGIDYPLALAPGEGFEVQPLSAMGAGGVGNLYVSATLAEISGVSWQV